MPHTRRMPFLYVLSFCLGCLYGAAAFADADGLPADTSGVRIWVHPSAYQDAAHAEAHFELEQVVLPDDALRIPCQVSISADLSDPHIRLRIYDDQGTPLFEAAHPLDELEGAFDSLFVWPLADVDDGTYRVRLAVLHALGETVAWREVLLEKCTYERLVRQSEKLSANMALIEEAFQRVPEGTIPTYSLVRAAIAWDGLERAEKLLQEGNWPLASAVMDYVQMLESSARALLTFAPLVPEISTPVRLPSPTNLEVREGAFFSSGEPVFLFGLHDPTMNPRSLRKLNRYGLNFSSIEISPEGFLLKTGVKDEVLSRAGDYLAKAEEQGLGVTIGLRTDTVSQSLDIATGVLPTAFEDSGATPPLDPLEARTICRRHIEALAPLITQHPSVNGISLAFEPRFHWEGEKVRREFIEAVARKYKGDRRLVNRIWCTRLRSLEEIEILWDYTRASYQYDWQSWHQHIVSSHFTWLADYADRVLPGIPKQITLPNTVFEAGEARTGINRETLAGITDVTACTADYEVAETAYAFPFPSPEISYRLLRSLAPKKPLVVLDAHFALDSIKTGEEASRYLHAAMWEAAMAGINGCALAPGAIWANPGALEGFCSASLDLNRVGEIVTAFQGAEAPIAVLWSMPSKIYRDGETFLNSVRRVYEGCAFFGFPIRFITESECTPAGLEDVAVLVLPEVPALADETLDAIDAYARAGGTIIRNGRPAPYTPTGGSRHDVIAQTDRTIFVRASDTPTVFLHALDAAYVFGVLPAIPRIINNYGYPLEGVKSRYVEHEGREYLYVVNLRKEPVKAYLFGGERQGRDVVRGRDVRFPMMLDSLDPMLVRLDPPAPAGSEQEKAVLMSKEGANDENILKPGPVVLEPVTP